MLFQKSLQNVEIYCKSYENIVITETEDNFVYFDPPYRPLTSSSSFTAYSKSGFNDDDQKNLANYVETISTKTRFMLSNSDPKNNDCKDDFFDKLYENFTIDRISAPRSINSDGEGRGEISEILVRNY